MGDLYQVGEAITIRAQLKDTQQDFGGIQAEIRSLTGESSLQPLQLTQTGDRWTVETGDLASGVYQVTVQTVQTSTGAPTAVRDVFEGHAFVAVSLKHSLKQWDDNFAKERNLFNTPKLFTGEENLTALKKLIDEEAYLAIECTGFAHTKSFKNST